VDRQASSLKPVSADPDKQKQRRNDTLQKLTVWSGGSDYP
jgi:hypothetical protein